MGNRRYPRLLVPLARGSFFLFGPRGTGKSTWLAETFPEAHVVDALHLLARLFGPGPDPAYPFPECGTVPTTSECEEFLSCL